MGGARWRCGEGGSAATCYRLPEELEDSDDSGDLFGGSGGSGNRMRLRILRTTWTSEAFRGALRLAVRDVRLGERCRDDFERSSCRASAASGNGMPPEADRVEHPGVGAEEAPVAIPSLSASGQGAMQRQSPSHAASWSDAAESAQALLRAARRERILGALLAFSSGRQGYCESDRHAHLTGAVRFESMFRRFSEMRGEGS
jgi:hypothetical protein